MRRFEFWAGDVLASIGDQTLRGLDQNLTTSPSIQRPPASAVFTPTLRGTRRGEKAVRAASRPPAYRSGAGQVRVELREHPTRVVLEDPDMEVVMDRHRRVVAWHRAVEWLPEQRRLVA